MMQKRILLRAVLLYIGSVAFISLGFSKENNNIFRSELARLELSIPNGWHFMDLEAVQRSRQSVRIKDEDMQQAIAQLASAPLVAVTKYPEPHESLNPSLQVIVRPLGNLEGASGKQILELILPTLKASFEGFKTIEPILEFELGGFNAARMMVAYTIKNEAGDTFPTKSIMMVIPRGSYMYQFGFSGTQDGPDVLDPELFDDVLKTVKFLE